MPFKTDSEYRGWYLHVTTTGTFLTVEEVEDYVNSLRTQALRHDTKKVLIDERGLMDHQDTHDAYEISESEAAAMAALAGMRLSCICHPDNYELNKMYETLLLNRSLIFKVFLREDEALAWLKA